MGNCLRRKLPYLNTVMWLVVLEVPQLIKSSIVM